MISTALKDTKKKKWLLSDIEVIDLFDGQQHSEDLQGINGYSSVRKLSKTKTF